MAQVSIGEIPAVKTMSARRAKNAFRRIIDTARAESVQIEKHGRGVVMASSVAEYKQLQRVAFA
jgi:hypothetical protein